MPGTLAGTMKLGPRCSLLDQAQGRVSVSPGMHSRLLDTAPPHLILKAQGLLRMPFGQSNQAVSISSFARTPNRDS
jgi:hypothetical protein